MVNGDVVELQRSLATELDLAHRHDAERCGGARERRDEGSIQPDFRGAESTVDHDMQLDGMPGSEGDGRTGGGELRHVVPQHQLALRTDVEADDPAAARRLVAHQRKPGALRLDVEV